MPTSAQPTLALVTVRVQFGGELPIPVNGISFTLTGSFVNRNSAVKPPLGPFTILNPPASGYYECPLANLQLPGLSTAVGHVTVGVGADNALSFVQVGSVPMTVPAGTMFTCSFLATYSGSLA
jgi:hypothetical protein